MACSDNGQHVVVGSTQRKLFTSHDYGATWNHTFTLPNGPYSYNDVVSSCNGQYWATLSYKGGIYISSDYGNTWVQTSAPSLDWISITSSDSGQFVTAVGGYDIYTSSDYGNTWVAAFAITRGWVDVSSSSSGQFLAAVAQNTGVFLSDDYGVSWRNATSVALNNKNWHNVAISSSGQKLVAAINGVAYISNDYGASWNVNSPPDFSLGTLQCSGNQYCLISGYDKFFVSDDFGATWMLNSAPFPSYGRATLSGNGQYAYGYISNTLYKMTRTAASPTREPTASPTRVPSASAHPSSIRTVVPTALPSFPHISWQNTSAPSFTWTSMACSSNGQFVVAVAVLGAGGIQVSNDSGVTWTKTSAASTDWNSVASSNTGQYLAATVFSGGIATSSDFGVTWIQRPVPSSMWYGIASSSSGQYIVALG